MSGVRPMTPCCPHTCLANRLLGHGKSACELNETASYHSAVVLLHRGVLIALSLCMMREIHVTCYSFVTYMQGVVRVQEYPHGH
jgi:hypothetical protein